MLRVIAVSLYKICNDLRWMGSGPRAGLGEIRHPRPAAGLLDHAGQGEPGHLRGVCQVCTQVIGNDAAVAFGGAAGNFELNVMMPVIARNLLASARLLAAVLPLLADRCVSGITALADHMRRLAESSPVIVTALNSYIGYEAAAQVAHEALETGRADPLHRDLPRLRGPRARSPRRSWTPPWTCCAMTRPSRACKSGHT